MSVDWPWGDMPLAYGYEVPVGVATTLLRACGCPLLPATGPASPEHIDRALANHVGDIALEYDNGVRMVFVPTEGHDAGQYETMLPQGIADAGFGYIVPIRGTLGFAQDLDEAHEGMVPSVTFVEGIGLIDVVSHSDLDVDDLVAFAESLPYCGDLCVPEG